MFLIRAKGRSGEEMLAQLQRRLTNDEPTEAREALEQLRALWHGYRISVTLADDMPLPGVDTPEDAARVRAYFAGRCAGN